MVYPAWWTNLPANSDNGHSQTNLMVYPAWWTNLPTFWCDLECNALLDFSESTVKERSVALNLHVVCNCVCVCVCVCGKGRGLLTKGWVRIMATPQELHPRSYTKTLYAT